MYCGTSNSLCYYFIVEVRQIEINCIVCDLDETLLNDEEKIDGKTTDLLIELQEAGILLILASGRGYKRMIAYAEQLHMFQHNGILIDGNGTSILNLADGKRERLSYLSKENSKEIFHTLRDETIEIQFNLDDAIYVYMSAEIYELKKKIRTEMRLPHNYPWTGGSYGWLSDMRDGYPFSTVVNRMEDVPEKINKITLNQDKEYIDSLMKKLNQNNLLSSYSMTKTSERTVEIVKKGVSKGNALKKVLEEKNLSGEQIIAFGNAENDISMFACTPNSYAVANALDNVKEYANYLTDSNNNSGVYQTLSNLVRTK